MDRSTNIAVERFDHGKEAYTKCCQLAGCQLDGGETLVKEGYESPYGIGRELRESLGDDGAPILVFRDKDAYGRELNALWVGWSTSGASRDQAVIIAYRWQKQQCRPSDGGEC